MWECIIEGGAELTQGYGCTRFPEEPGCPACPRWHSGYDLAARCGRAVHASCSGTVIQLGHDPGYGPHAVFLLRDVDGAVELYGHLRDAMVQVGDHVAAGQVIGHVGDEGHSFGCHVHYSVRPGDDILTECGALDPKGYICSCSAPSGRAPLSGGAILLLLGAGPRLGLVTHSPAAPGLGVTWEP